MSANSFKKVYVLILPVIVGVFLYCFFFSITQRSRYKIAQTRHINDSLKLLRKPPNLQSDSDHIIDYKGLLEEYFPDADPRPYYIINDNISKQSHLPTMDFDTFQTVSSRKPICFFADTFKTNREFKLAKINCDVKFGNCKMGYSNLNDTTIDHSGFGIQQIEFNKTVYFINNDFFDDFSISSSQFNECVSFIDNNFHKGDVFFDGSYFKKGLDISSMVRKTPWSDKSKRLNIIVEFNGDTIRKKLNMSHINFADNDIKNIKFLNSIVDSLDISFDDLIDTISLQKENITLAPKKHWWVKSSFYNFFFSPFFDTIEYEKTRINLTNVDIKKVSIDYSLLQPYFNSSATENQKNSVYVALLDKYLKNGETENYKAADIDYHDFQGGVFNLFSKYWWNYGYSKWLIFIWCAFFISIFSLFNFLLLPKIYYAYPLQHISGYHHWIIKQKGLSNKSKKRLKYFLCLIYTCIVFFGIKLDLDNLKFYKLLVAIFILFQFTIGLICTGFIIHLIVQ